MLEECVGGLVSRWGGATWLQIVYGVTSCVGRKNVISCNLKHLSRSIVMGVTGVVVNTVCTR